MLLAVLCAAPARAYAQAWVAPRGEGSVSIGYQHLFVEDHLFSGGVRRDVGHVRTHIVSVDIDYGVTDRLSARASIPFAASKFLGGRPHIHSGSVPGTTAGHSIDEGAYNLGPQDFRADLRYSAMELPIAITPFVALVVPSHDYEFFGHSAIGLNMPELQVGTYVGIVKVPFYVQGRYAFGFPKRVIGQRRPRSNVDVEVGWLPSSRVRLFAFQSAQVSHRGLELLAGVERAGQPELEWLHHDRLGRANSMNVGGGTSIAVTRTLSVHGSGYTTVSGSNTHATKYGLAVGATWGFGAARRGHHTTSHSR